MFGLIMCRHDFREPVAREHYRVGMRWVLGQQDESSRRFGLFVQSS